MTGSAVILCDLFRFNCKTACRHDNVGKECWLCIKVSQQAHVVVVYPSPFHPPLLSRVKHNNDHGEDCPSRVSHRIGCCLCAVVERYVV